jgi:hypothetical protein
VDVHCVDFFSFLGLYAGICQERKARQGVIVSCHRLSRGCMLWSNRGGCCVEMQMQILAYSYLLVKIRCMTLPYCMEL